MNYPQSDPGSRYLQNDYNDHSNHIWYRRGPRATRRRSNHSSVPTRRYSSDTHAYDSIDRLEFLRGSNHDSVRANSLRPPNVTIYSTNDDDLRYPSSEVEYPINVPSGEPTLSWDAESSRTGSRIGLAPSATTRIGADQHEHRTQVDDAIHSPTNMSSEPAMNSAKDDTDQDQSGGITVQPKPIRVIHDSTQSGESRVKIIEETDITESPPPLDTGVPKKVRFIGSDLGTESHPYSVYEPASESKSEYSLPFYSSDLLESDDESLESFDFSLSKEFEINDAKDTDEGKPSHISPASTIQIGTQNKTKKTTYKVVQSQYENLGEEGGDLTARLGIEHTVGQSSQSNAEIFSWLHLENEYMDFQSFINCAIQFVWLSEKDRHDIKKDLQKLRKQSEKPLRTPQGTCGMYAEATIFEEFTTPKGDVPDQERMIVAATIPFFMLAKYAVNSLPEKSPLHPLRTILQTQHPSTRKERDLQQAVCRLTAMSRDSCLHVGQLWCLVLNDCK
jgi:hypothetical protein